MAVFSLLVKNKSVEQFFVAFKTLKCNVSGLKAVVLLSNGLDVTFVSEAAVREFLQIIEGKDEWEVVCDLSTTTIVTLAPRGQGGHALISDEVVVSFLKKHCKVLEGKRLYYKDFPSVQTGVRQFRVRLGESPIPSSVNFGRAAFFVSHRGQVKTCFKCKKTGHEAKECDTLMCHKCGEEGHVMKNCVNDIKCVVCDSLGHTFRNCPKSYSRALNLGSKFSKISPEAVDSVKVPQVEHRAEKQAEVADSQSSATDTQCMSAALEAEAGKEVEQEVGSQDLFLSPLADIPSSLQGTDKTVASNSTDIPESSSRAATVQEGDSSVRAKGSVRTSSRRGKAGKGTCL